MGALEPHFKDPTSIEVPPAGNSLASAQVAEPKQNGLSLHQDLERTSRQTKVIATIGRVEPYASMEEKIEDLIRSGVNVFRLNFSHGSYQSHAEVIETIRATSKRLNVPIGIMQDLCGPKLRLGDFLNGEASLVEGESVSFRHASKGVASAEVLTTEAFRPEEILGVGDRFFLADGKYELKVTETEADGVRAEVIRGGTVRSRAGISMPEAAVSLPAITQKDLADLEWGLKHGVDFVVLSFVRGADEVQQLRDEMKQLGRVVPIVAKIERKVALQKIDEITQCADALMVGRGDLGTEIPIEQVPAAQRKTVNAALRFGRPVTVATHMLLSMQTSPHPTRAEVGDVERAALDGADSVMLSEETAIGQFPADAVNVMTRAAKAGEIEFDFNAHNKLVPGEGKFECRDDEVIALSAAAASIVNGISAIILASDSPEAPALLAKHRPRVPVYGCSDDWENMQRMTLYWGIHPLPYPHAAHQLARPSSAEKKEYAFVQAATRHFALNPEASEFGAIIVNGSNPLPHSPMSRLEIRRASRAEIETRH